MRLLFLSEAYISPSTLIESSYTNVKNPNKLDYVSSMFESDSPYFKVCLEEFEWLHNVEQDTKIKRLIKKCINEMKSQ